MIDLAMAITKHLRALGYADTYCDLLPDQPDAAVAVYEYTSGSPYGGLGFDDGLAARNVQVRVRGANREDAGRVAGDIYALLRTPGDGVGVALGGVEMIFRPRQPPAVLERDARDRVVFVWSLTVVTPT